jgi:gluconokinase
MLSSSPNRVANDALILTIDVGSSSVRAMILDRDGDPLDGVFAQEHYQLESTPDGGATFDPVLTFNRIMTCIDTAIQHAGQQVNRIGAVAMDTLVSNVVGVDRNGEPVTPIYTWADTRGGDLADSFRRQLSTAGLSTQDYTQRTGCYIHTSYWPLRLLWLQKTEPEAFQRAEYWMSLGEYVLYKLCGERKVTPSIASWGGLFNRSALDFDDQVLQAVGIRRDQLSTPSSAPLATTPDRWPELRSALWFPAIADGVSSNIGAGCTQSSHVALSVGTSGAIRIVVPGTPDQVPEGLFAYRVDDQRSLIGGALSNAGNLFAWMQRVLKTPSLEDCERLIASMPPDAHGLTLLPFLAGERSPGWNPQAEAVFFGMTHSTTPAQLLTAGLEAVAYRFAQIARRLAPLLPKNPVYIASGAAILSSPAWMQIVADVLNAPVCATVAKETTIRGTAALVRGYEPTPVFGERYLPALERHIIYQAAIGRQEVLYQRMFG